MENELDGIIRTKAQSFGIDLYGVSSTRDFSREFPSKAQPDLFLRDARSVIYGASSTIKGMIRKGVVWLI
jgi:hypothetical protein